MTYESQCGVCCGIYNIDTTDHQDRLKFAALTPDRHQERMPRYGDVSSRGVTNAEYPAYKRDRVAGQWASYAPLPSTVVHTSLLEFTSRGRGNCGHLECLCDRLDIRNSVNTETRSVSGVLTDKLRPAVASQ